MTPSEQPKKTEKTDSSAIAPSLTAIILAGGMSRRMGQDKALIPIQGQPMLRQVCQVALACTPQVWIVTPWPQRYQSIVPISCRFITETPLSAADAASLATSQTMNHGPLIGFAQGLAQVQTDWVLLLACDLPRLDAVVIQQWMQQLDQVPPSAIALLSHQPQGWEPLCGFYRRTCLASLQNFIAAGGRSFQQWLNQETVQQLPGVDAEMLMNCNTPTDLKRVST